MSFRDSLGNCRILAAVKVLLVEDDRRLAESLRRSLSESRMTVDVSHNGEDGLAAAAANPYDVIVLDVMLPRLSGLEVARRLRESRVETPILMLTARDAVDDRVAGLDAGADDYLVKPFALRELEARLRALLRRLGARPRQSRLGAPRLEVSRTESALLELFLRHPRQVLERSVVFEQVWGYDFGATSNVLGVYMGYLRRKTEAGGEPRLLHTVRGVRHVLRDRPAGPFRRRLRNIDSA